MSRPSGTIQHMRGLVEEGRARGRLAPMQRLMHILEATRM